MKNDSPEHSPIKRLKIGYFGSPAISASLLKSILDESVHEVVFVVSNPDRPRGRSGKLVATEVSELALSRNLPLFRFESLKKHDHSAELRDHKVDLYVVFAYGKILPESIFKIPPKGTINLHASLLPLLRGASPIQSSILQGFESTAWTLQELAVEMDAGDVIASSPPIGIDLKDTAGDLTEKILPSGIQLTLNVLNNFDEIFSKKSPQDHKLATFCPKILPEMANIRWGSPTIEIQRLIMGMNPSPVARTILEGKPVKIYRTCPAKNEFPPDDLIKKSPGELFLLTEGRKKRVFVKTGDGLLEIVELQPENRKVMKAADFLNGFQWKPGMKFE